MKAQMVMYPPVKFQMGIPKKVANLKFPFEKPQAKVHHHVIFHMGRRVGAFPCERSHGDGTLACGFSKGNAEIF